YPAPPTEKGTVVGTAAYMSPEQAAGKNVDARSDIFSFGAVLYETITGQRAFRGESSISTLSSILHNEPIPVEQLRQGTPPEVSRILARCLRKDPDRRFQTAADLKVALQEIQEESETGKLASAPVSASERRSAFLLLAVVGTLLLVA